jgi:hypothetical protein
LPGDADPILTSLNASVNCFCLASHHICCLCTTSGYLADNPNEQDPYQHYCHKRFGGKDEHKIQGTSTK